MHDIDISPFKDALEAEGLHNVTVQSDIDLTKDAIVIRSTMRVDGTKYGDEQVISGYEQSQIDDMDKHLARLAGQVARSFKESTRERREWGKSLVEFDMTNGSKVSCLRCGASVSSEDLRSALTSTWSSESTVPNPQFSHDSLSEHKIEMAMLGLLKDECDNRCPNSPTETLKYPDSV
jgi:hypothetical protein